MTVDELIKDFNAKDKHDDYKVTVEIANRIKGHATGDKKILGELLSERRPSELDETLAYRLKIAIARTKGTVSKVFTSLSKAPHSPEWGLQWDMEAGVKYGADSLFEYITNNYPKYKNIQEWAFSYLIRQILIDPNSLMITQPNSLNVKNVEYLKPETKVYSSENVLQYKEGEYAVVLSNETIKLGKHGRKGAIYIFVTKTEYAEYVEIDLKGTKELREYYVHNFGYLPVRKLKGVLIDDTSNTGIYESLIDAMAPSLDEAYREYSDLQAEVVQHVHSTMWAYATQDCRECSGIGRVAKGESLVECSACLGKAKVTNSPYQKIILQPASLTEQAIQGTPAGFITKDTSIVEIQDRRIKQHLYDALSAIHMEFIAEVPLAQSGIAKAYDRQETEAFIYSVVALVADNLKFAIFCTNDYRYSVITKNAEERKKQLPKIYIPTSFDMIPANKYLENIAAIKNAGGSHVIISELQKKYAKMEFANDKEVNEMLKLSFDLDPLYSLSTMEKTDYSNNGWISKQSAVISANIQEFITRALAENKDFAGLPKEKQAVIISGYAQERIDEIDDIPKLIE